MSKRIAFVALASALLLALPGRGEAQVSLGPTPAYHGDFDFGLGAMVGVPVPALADGVGVMSDFTFFFPEADGFDLWEINGNLTYDLPVDGPVSPFLLGGLSYARMSIEAEVLGETVSVSDGDLAYNLGAGIRLPLGTFEPMVGVRTELGRDTAIALFMAVPFRVGG